MTYTRRRALAATGAGLALLAGCTGSSSPDDANDTDNPDGTTTVKTTDEGVTIAVQNSDVTLRSIRVTGAGSGTAVTLAPGGSYDAGVLYAPVEGETTYEVAVFVDGEELATREVTVTAGETGTLEATVTTDGVTWSDQDAA